MTRLGRAEGADFGCSPETRQNFLKLAVRRFRHVDELHGKPVLANVERSGVHDDAFFIGKMELDRHALGRDGGPVAQDEATADAQVVNHEWDSQHSTPLRFEWTGNARASSSPDS